jgi:hypothetical protein
VGLQFECVFFEFETAMPSRKRLMQQAAAPWTCAGCALPYTSLVAHYREHPKCRPPGLVAAAERPEVLEEHPPGADALAALTATNTLREEVAWDLLELRHKYGFDDCQVDQVKRTFEKWIGSRDAAVLDGLPDQATLEAATIGIARLPLFSGIETQKKEMAYAKNGLPYLQPRVKDLSENGGRNPIPNPNLNPNP